MDQFLLILHLLGLGASVAAAVGNTVVGARVAAAPQDAPVLGQLSPIFARVGQIGLALLWVTGPIMVWTKYEGGATLTTAFYIKFVGVVVLTGLVVLISLRIKRVAGGDLAAAKPLPVLGRFAGLTLLAVVIFAVIAFR
ncbi:MAG: hypothetical protein ACTSYE_09620 [Alphaproteobacteria bacterium]